MCTYFPEEVAYAAGVLPVRIISKNDTDGLSDRYLYGTFCPRTRGILAQGLKGEYDYLDGVGHGECCMQVRATWSSWRLHVPTPFNYFVAVPSYPEHPRSKILLKKELSFFKKALEAWTGKTITESALDHAIEVYNTNRRLMRQVYELRRADKPKVSGAEALEMVISSQIMDKEEHNRLLMDAISKLPNRKDRGEAGARLMVLGSEIIDSKLFRLIGSLGATVVIEESCTSSNYIWNNVIPQEDRLMAIGQRYLDRPRCPIKDVRFRRRVNYLMEMAEDYNVQGVIIAMMKYCGPHQFGRPPIEKGLRERFIPFHNIEHDGTIHTGEYKIRLEAFINTIVQPVLV
jgi:benzoyl-CoA reductase subunit C